MPDRSLTWAFLQEKLTTTAYGPADAPERFKFPVFLLTIQSLFAFLGGKLFSILTTPRGQPVPALIPNRQILPPLLLVAFTNALAAPFGYAALAHIDYITFILAKSCKLLPVMFLHITVFRKRYPLYKYLVVAAVTCGVAVFTLHSGSRKAHHKPASHSGQTAWGMLLLGINLLFDGLTNSTQDYIFGNFQPYTGPQMMAANNLLGSAITGGYLVLSPWLVHTPLGEWFGMDLTGSSGELKAALAFLARHPAVWRDVLGFALCGCVGQVFICTSSFLVVPFPSPFSSLTFLASSPHAIDVLLCPARHRHRHAQDVHHDPQRRGLWPPPLPHAVARRRPRVWRHRRRGPDRPPREAGQGGGQAGAGEEGAMKRKSK